MDRRSFFKKMGVLLAALGFPLSVTKRMGRFIPDAKVFARTGDTFVPYSMGVDGDAVQSIVMHSGIDGAFDWVAFDRDGLAIDWSDRDDKPEPQGYFVPLPDTNECDICEDDLINE